MIRIMIDQVKTNISAGFWILAFLTAITRRAIRANVNREKRIAKGDPLMAPNPGNERRTLPKEKTPPSESNAAASPTVAAPPLLA